GFPDVVRRRVVVARRERLQHHAPLDGEREAVQAARRFELLRLRRLLWPPGHSGLVLNTNKVRVSIGTMMQSRTVDVEQPLRAGDVARSVSSRGTEPASG